MVPRAFEKSICLVFVVVVVVVFVSPRKEEEAKRNIIFQCLHSLFFFCFLSGVSFCVPLFICVVSSFQKKSIKKKKEREKTKTDFGQTKKE